MIMQSNLYETCRPRERSGALRAITHENMKREEGLFWLDQNRLGEALSEPHICVNTAWGTVGSLLADIRPAFSAALMNKADKNHRKVRIHLLALGDVGGTVLIGLKLLGGGVISKIGICDLSPDMCRRWEYEMNQTTYPWNYDAMPEVEIVPQEHLFDCDVFVFCASRAVPALGAEGTDVRMVQFEANRKIIAQYAKMAAQADFPGLFAVVSDPVEPLCREALWAAGMQGEASLRPEQIQGYGLGVMNGRAAYYAKKDPRFSSFLTEGRAYGPHGNDLVIANSIEHYDDELSRELTKLAAEANLRTRETGFKPYIAPALSSAAISLILTLSGEWHYSSVFLGGVYMGCKNRFGEWGLETEALPLPQALYDRLQYAWERLDAVR